MSDTYTPSAGYANRRRPAIERSTPQQALELHNLALNTRILADTNPWMGNRPDVLMELAGSGLPPDQLATQGAALYGMQSMDALQETLGQLTPVAQRSVYGRLTETQQRSLDQLGYQPPNQEAGGGILSGTMEAIGTVARPVWEGVSTVGGPVIGGALDVLTWVGDQPAHLYRAIRSMDSWQQWVAVGGAVAALALAPVTFGTSLAAAGSLTSLGILGGSALAGATVAAAVTNPAEWWDALNATWDGEKVFTQSAQREARDLLGGDELVAMAKEIALDLDPYDLATDIAGERGGGDQQILDAIQRVAAEMADPGSPEYEALFGGLVNLTNQEPFRQAIDTLQQGKISFGRDVARAAGLDPNTTTYNLMSGMVDGVWAVSMDPTMAAGALVKWNRVRRAGVGMEGGDAFLDRLVHLSNTDRLTRANHESIAVAVNTGDFTMMPPAARKMWQPLREWKHAQNIDEFDRAELLRWFEEGDGIRRVLEGKGTIRGVEHAVISRRSESAGWGRFVRELREFRDAADDVVLERHMRRLSEKYGVELELDELLPANVLDEGVRADLVDLGELVDRDGLGVGAALGTALGRVRVGDPLISLMSSITRMTPSSKAIRIVGEGVEEDVQRLVETMGRTFNMPSRVRDEWLNAILTQGSGNQRLAVIQSFVDTAFRIAGMRSNDEVAVLADRYLHKFGQAYALGGLDKTAIDGIMAATGVYPELHQASLVVMPDLPEMLKAVRRGHILKHVARVTDSNFVEQSMSRFWKPAVLLRIGFIPRAAGEEMLAWAARISEGGIAQEYGARSIAQLEQVRNVQRALAEGAVRTPEMEKILSWQVPTHARPLVRMFSRTGWADPVEQILTDYGTALRGFLGSGLGVDVGAPAWHHGLLLGKEQSWRRAILGGVDPVLQDAARSWANGNADAIMRSTSALNASGFEKSVVNPDIDTFLVEDPTGQLIEEPMVTVRGQRERVVPGDRRFPAAVHHRLAEAFDDEIVGRILARLYPYYFPGFNDLQPANVLEAIELSRNVQSYTGRKILAEALQPRGDNWRAAADSIRDIDPLAASALDDALMSGDVAWTDVIDGLRRAADDADEVIDRKRIEGLITELESVNDLVAGMESLGVMSQAWMAASLSADMASGGRFYDTDSMRRWASGATETVTARPKRILYRGVKSGETIQVMPDGSLVLKPQWNEDWGGDVISTSTSREQAMTYAVSAGSYNEANDVAMGVVIELDADEIMSDFGTTWDDMVRNGSLARGNITDELGPGAYLHTSGTDVDEVSLVFNRSNGQYLADDIVVAPGKWSIQNTDDMQRVVDELPADLPGNRAWLGNLRFSARDGRPVTELFEDLTTLARGDVELAGDIDRTVSWLQGLNADERHVVRTALGWSDDLTDRVAAERLARRILTEPRMTQHLQETMSLRGAGEFTQTQPAWSPFYTDRESFDAALENEIWAELMRPENAEHVRRSRFALETPDGRRVAHPMQEGVQRVYQPTLGAQPKVMEIALQAQAAGVPDIRRAVVDELLASPWAMRSHPDFIRRLPEEARRRALSNAVDSFLTRATSTTGEWSGPLHGVGYSDPRIAQWVSDVITGGVARQPTRTAYVDIPRGLGGSSDQMADLGEAGRSWALSAEHDGMVNWIDGDGIVQLADGSHAPGVAYSDALREYAKVIRKKIATEHGARTRESYNALEVGEGVSGLQRRRGNELVPVQPGERFGSREDLFDVEGRPVQWADPNLFGTSVVSSDELLWPIIGPMIRDWHESRAGLTSMVRKSKRKALGAYEPGDIVPADDQIVRMTRSRIDDINRTRELDLPNVALSEVRQPTHDRLWDRIVRHGFDRVIGPSIDALVRTPMSFHYYAQAYRQNRQFLGWMLDRNLLDTRIPEVFASHLDALEGATRLSTKQLADARAVGLMVGADLADADEVDIARFIASIGDSDGYVAELGKISSAARRRKDRATAQAAERLMSIDPAPLKLLDVAGSGPTSERLVAAYARNVPRDAWERGAGAVNKAIADAELGLPVLDGEQWNVMSAAARNYLYATETVEETAKLRALENVIPFLDSHEQRTMFASMGRNLMPFWYAEENFLKRWARTMAIDGTFGLATLRKAQLSYMGIRSAGIVRTDANGKDWFVYPGSGLLAEGLAKLPIIPDTLPVGVMFQADPEQMLPGVNTRFGTPSVSPWVAAPLDVVERIFPDAKPLNEAILGEYGSQKGALEQFVPTTVSRFWEAAFQDENSSQRYAAAMMAAAAMMEAEGNGLPDGATPDQLEEHLDKLRNHARIVMWSQMITGFVVPGSPIAINTGEDVGSFGWMSGLGIDSPDELVSDRYRSYVQNLGIDEGVQAFLRDFPNADLEDVVNPLAYTTSTSQSVSGAPLPATRTGMVWYDQNQSWVDSMPEAGAWFLPPDADGAEFDYYSYSQQLTNNLRKRQRPEDFIRSLKYRAAASPYFEAREQYEIAATQLENDQVRKSMLDDAWESWRTSWMASHPIFAEELVSGEARQRRQRTIDQLRYAVSDPQAPDSPSSAAIREISEAYDGYQTALTMLADRRDADSTDRKRLIKQAWQDWAEQWALRNPDIDRLWSAVFRPESSL